MPSHIAPPLLSELQLLSNGRLHVMVTVTGEGYSRWNNLVIARWREDGTRELWGMFCYLRDLESGHFWSTTYQPTRRSPEHCEFSFRPGRATFRRIDHKLSVDP